MNNGLGQIDAASAGVGRGDPAPSGTQVGTGRLVGGNLGPIVFNRQYRTWGKAPRTKRRDQIDIDATNIAKAAINVRRARVDCDAHLNLHSDGPIAVRLLGCGRTVHASGR